MEPTKMRGWAVTTTTDCSMSAAVSLMRLRAQKQTRKSVRGERGREAGSRRIRQCCVLGRR